MKILIIAKHISIGEEILAEIIRIPPEEIRKERGYILAKFRNGDTIEVRLISSVLRGLKVDKLYLPKNIDPNLKSDLIPLLMLSPYKDFLNYYEGGKIC